MRNATRPQARSASVVNNQIVVTNNVWSGFGNYKRIPAYSTKGPRSSIKDATAAFNVPIAQDAFGETGCSALGASGIVELMVGIDAPTLEGGVLAENPGWINWPACQVSTPLYYAQFGAGTSNSIVQAFNVNVGDLMEVYVWDTSPTNGYVAILDVTSQVGNTWAVTTNAITADSAEFIMGKVTFDGSLAEIPNYVQSFWVPAYAQDFAGHFYGPGTNSKPSTDYVGTYSYLMTDNAGDQDVSYSTPYRYPFNAPSPAETSFGLAFYEEGCDYINGCSD